MEEPVIPKNLFGEAVIQPFPDLTDGEIDTTLFLQSSRGVVRIVEAFGQPFMPVQRDISQNIKTLQEIFNQNPRDNITIDKMISRERSLNEHSAGQALLWLMRGLQYFHRFLTLVVNDFREGYPTEDLIGFARQAYDETLFYHHSWLARQLFQVLCRFCPTRSVLTLKLVIDRDQHTYADHHRQLMLDIDRYLISLGATIDHINGFCLG
ncbi:putative protein PLEKHA9 [Anabrus simplex]|uniref:putative protein PLEKHA9 n=1 Tax=Anabrus simplex TaxID=316456 RepID=UPI0035A2B964